MLEIILLKLLSKKITKIYEEKNIEASGYVIKTIILWFALEFLGIFIGYRLLPHEIGLMYVFGLLGAATGALISLELATKTPPVPEPIGLRILDFIANSYGRQLGFKPGDDLTMFNSNKIKLVQQLKDLIDKNADMKVTYCLLRGEEKVCIEAEAKPLGIIFKKARLVGLHVLDFIEGAYGKELGFKSGDNLTMFNSNKIKTIQQLKDLITEHSGMEVTYSLIRGTEELKINAEAKPLGIKFKAAA